ncbi:ligand-binding sensor domain-containing protein [Aliikangiella coralliicola]|uniref:Two component regulator three Y domain-containing protein n=1 Tax=Aliikangiella coralliicola TaxID=2592383 RepID=A0A545TS82_9GAMM|nr:two-component regulator propeller domain-containing protein [Aliikangiella coralliicola]TQV80001.1 hypothetical protein FLL46_26700 [Aliikangiella coralliicola]
MKNVTVLMLLVTTIFLLAGANAADLENTGFKHISTEHGLSQKTVQAIYQDSQDFLWFGTQEGLNRYDGKELKVFRHLSHNQHSLSHDVIRAIIEDAYGDLWVATSGGLNRYIAENESFERVKVFDGQEEVSRFNTLFLDSNKVLWAGSDGNGIFLIEGENSQRNIQKFRSNDILEKADVRAIFEDSRERFWVGTDGNGAFLFNSSNVTHFLPDDNNARAISHARIRSVLEDSRGRIWLGTRGGGLNRYDELSKSFEVYRHAKNDDSSLTHDRVYQVFEDRDQTLWIATDGGISIFNAEKNNFLRIVHKSSQRTALNHNRVLAVNQDNGGLLWFGTLSGLNQWNPNHASFIHYRNIIEDASSLSNNTVYALAENIKGDIYIGTFGGGLNLLNAQTNNVGVTRNPAGETFGSKIIMSLMVAADNTIWVGSISDGVEVYTPDFELLKRFKNNPENEKSLSADGVTKILQDSDGEIWIGTYQAGINRLDRKSGTFKRYRLDETGKSENGNGVLKSENIYNFIEDDEGYLWLATDGGGISRLDKNTEEFQSFMNNPQDPESLSGNIASFIYQDSKGRIWVGTQGNGLNRWEPGDRRKGLNRFKHYTIENGLNSSTVNGIVEDTNGHIWISTVKGVSRLDPDSDQIDHFNLTDEIHKNELNQGAILKASNGRLYFGGLNGVSAFFPTEIKQNTHVPPVTLTKVLSENKLRYFEQPLATLKEVTFDHNDYLIAFEFAGLDFAQPDKNRYQYKLEGFDSEWIDSGHLNRATFTNLPAGSFILRVRASNNDGVWSSDSINLKVNVLPAPWVSWWAFALYGLGFCVLLLLIIRMQAKRLANQELFQSRVSKQVSKKIAIHSKNNEFLKKQVEQLKHQANVDIETGLPNQRFMSDFVAANIDWVSQLERDSQKSLSKLLVTLIRVFIEPDAEKKEEDLTREVVELFNRELSEQECFLRVARWSENDIGVVSFLTEAKKSQQIISQWLTSLKNIANKIVPNADQKIYFKLAYSLSPFDGVQQDNMSGDSLMVLTEHLLHLVADESDYESVGIVRVNQNLNSVKMAQIMDAKRIDELDEIFTLECR